MGLSFPPRGYVIFSAFVLYIWDYPDLRDGPWSLWRASYRWQAAPSRVKSPGKNDGAGTSPSIPAAGKPTHWLLSAGGDEQSYFWYQGQHLAFKFSNIPNRQYFWSQTWEFFISNKFSRDAYVDGLLDREPLCFNSSSAIIIDIYLSVLIW